MCNTGKSNQVNNHTYTGKPQTKNSASIQNTSSHTKGAHITAVPSSELLKGLKIAERQEFPPKKEKSISHTVLQYSKDDHRLSSVSAAPTKGCLEPLSSVCTIKESTRARCLKEKGAR